MVCYQMDAKWVYDPDWIARHLGIDLAQVMLAIDAGQLRATALGEQWLVKGDWVLAWLERESQPRVPRA